MRSGGPHALVVPQDQRRPLSDILARGQIKPGISVGGQDGIRLNHQQDLVTDVELSGSLITGGLETFLELAQAIGIGHRFRGSQWVRHILVPAEQPDLGMGDGLAGARKQAQGDG